MNLHPFYLLNFALLASLGLSTPKPPRSPCSRDLVEGFNQPRFQSVRDLVEQQISLGEEIGVSLAVDIDGESVVDIWGGYLDEDRTTKWERDTIVNLFSVTKTVTSLAALVLIDRGVLNPYEKVATYWPEFAANGKQDIEIRHIISHTSGLAGWEENVTLADICDFEYASSLLGAQAPWWEPGAASGYHSFTHGFLIGEVIRRTIGISLKEFVAEEMAKPLCADFQIGACPESLHRLSDVIPNPGEEGPPTSTTTRPTPTTVSEKVADNPPFLAYEANTAMWRNAEIGAANGHGNARSLVKLLSTISLGGTSGGVPLLRKETVDLVFQPQANGTDLVVGIPLRFGMGFGIAGPGVEPSWLPAGRIAYWLGKGGSLVVMDMDRKMTIAYAMNKMQSGAEDPDPALGSKLAKLYFKEIYRIMKEG